MTDGDHILQAILDDPEDDLHRLAYADWLEEQGRMPGADFIRKQIASTVCAVPESWIDETVRNAVGNYYQSMKGKGVATLTTHHVATPHINVNYRRGFVCRVKCDWSVWRTHGVAIVRRHPVVEVELADKRPRVGPGGEYASWRVEGAGTRNDRTADWTLGKAILAKSLFARLPRSGLFRQARERQLDYRHPDAAWKALSVAAIAWAKSQPAAEVPT